MKNIIISGFSGIGKSAAAGCYKDTVIDLESSEYSKIYTFDISGKPIKLQNPDFPKNYVDAIIKEYRTGENKIILISCHETVRDALRASNIPYIIIMPEDCCKNEYVIRWLARGSASEFIQNMFTHWGEYHYSCERDPSPKIYLAKDDYLVKVINRIFWERNK